MKAGLFSITCNKCGKRYPAKMGYPNLPEPVCPYCGAPHSYLPKKKK